MMACVDGDWLRGPGTSISSQDGDNVINLATYLLAGHHVLMEIG